jgi:hypothetical protein
MSKQKWYVSHAETLAQNVFGLLIGFLVLQAFGISVSESLQLQAVLFVASYIRSYIIRRTFNSLGDRL